MRGVPPSQVRRRWRRDRPRLLGVPSGLRGGREVCLPERGVAAGEAEEVHREAEVRLRLREGDEAALPFKKGT